VLLDHACLCKMARFGAEESVAESLVRAFRMVMGDELGNGGSQGLFSEQEEAVQAGFFDTAHKSFGMGVQIGRLRW
jgi:hypothetical protein